MRRRRSLLGAGPSAILAAGPLRRGCSAAGQPWDAQGRRSGAPLVGSSPLGGAPRRLLGAAVHTADAPFPGVRIEEGLGAEVVLSQGTITTVRVVKINSVKRCTLHKIVPPDHGRRKRGGGRETRPPV